MGFRLDFGPDPPTRQNQEVPRHFREHSAFERHIHQGTDMAEHWRAPKQGERIDGGRALIHALELEGTEVVFGLPGGAILPVYDPIIDSPIRHILVRHEQGAGHMAEGFAHATGRPGVAMVTSGPGATNIVTPLCRRVHGLDPDGGHHGPGGHRRDRDRRVPGGRHRRHHPLGHEAQRARDPRRGHPPRHPRGVPHRHDRSPRARARRHPQGHRRPEASQLRHGVGLAERRRRRWPGSPVTGPPPRATRRRSAKRPSSSLVPAGRCCTSAAASSRRAPPRHCASSPR